MSVVITKLQFFIMTETIVIGIVQKKEINSMYIEESIWGYVIMLMVIIGFDYYNKMISRSRYKFERFRKRFN